MLLSGCKQRRRFSKMHFLQSICNKNKSYVNFSFLKIIFILIIFPQKPTEEKAQIRIQYFSMQVHRKICQAKIGRTPAEIPL